MSAINDALRKASSAAKTPASAPSTQPPLPPANVPPWVAPPAAPLPPPAPAPIAPPPIIATLDSSVSSLDGEEPKKRSKLPVLLVLLFLICAAGAAGFYFFGKGRLFAQAREKTQPQEKLSGKDQLAAMFGDPKVAGQIATETVRSNQVSAKPEPSVAPVVPEPTPKAAPPVAAAPKPAPASTPAAAPRAPAQFPPLRLQSIFYRPSSPSVMINGKTLFVDDQINGVTIADIQPSSVTLVLSGQTNVLTLR